MVLQANPQLLNLFADLYADNLPLSNTIEIKNRLKTLVPPQILEAGKTGKMPEQAQTPSPQDQLALAQVKQQEAQIQQQQEMLNLKKAELEMKIQEAKAKNDIALLELEMKKIQALQDIEVARMRYLAETDRTASDNAIAHADNLTKILTTKMEGY
jgi:multidrug resistance efflux pump